MMICRVFHVLEASSTRYSPLPPAPRSRHICAPSSDLFPCTSNGACESSVDSKVVHLSSVFLELPVSVVERTDLTSLEPSRDAVEMKGVLGHH
jgi:hypothetical protein